MEGRRKTPCGKSKLPRSTRRGLVVLILMMMMMMTVVPLSLATMTNTGGNHQTDDVSNIAREGSPPTGIYWAKSYGGIRNDDAWSVQQTSDGGYIVGGITNSSGAGRWDAWVLKLDSLGSVTWQKTYGGSGSDGIWQIQQTSDGGYIAAGWTTSSGAGEFDAWLLKLTPTGSVTWQRAYGGTRNDTATSVQQTSSGDYVVAGYTNSFGNGSYDLWVFKLDSSGSNRETYFNRTYGGKQSDYAWSIQQTSDGGYIVAGGTFSYGAGGGDFWVLKLDSIGSVTWQNTYGSIVYDEAESVRQTSDGGYIVAGVSEAFCACGGGAWVLKLDYLGGITWQKIYNGTAYGVANSIEQTSDGGYVVAGYKELSGQSTDDFWVLKLSSTGSVTWQNTYGGSGFDEAVSVEQTSDDGYVVAGITTSFGSGLCDAWVIKLGVDGDITWNTGSGASTYQTSVTSADTHVTPNPTPVVALGHTIISADTTVSPADSSATVKTQATPDNTPPATITDLATSNPTANSITLMWTAPGGDGMVGNAAGYVVKYSTSGPIDASNWGSATTYPQSWAPLDSSETDTHVISGLNNATRYWFAVEAYDEALNYGAVSNTASGITTDVFPPATVTSLATGSPTDNSISLAWIAPGDNGTLGMATGYIVKYSTSGPINDSNWNSATTYAQTWTPLPAGNTEIQMVSGLNPSTRYWFAIKAYDKIPNYGRASNSPSGTTTGTGAFAGLNTGTLLMIGGGAGAVVVVLVIVVLVKKKRSPMMHI
jgi:uncharacterized delta-60 repeat protein